MAGPPEISAAKLALAARQARAHPGTAGVLASEPLAIVGMGCRFPGGGDSPEHFWQALDAGVDAIREVPADRWDVDRFYDPDVAAPGKMSTRWGAFLDRVDGFDPAFFGIAPREAASMDPQQRLLLEVAWEALEDAGLPQARLAGSRSGVFAAVYGSDYAQHLFASRDAIDAYTSLGTAHHIAADRLAFWLDLHGPSLVINTACSSSLVAVHLACQSLRSGECDLALAGGVSLILSPDLGISLSKWGFMAADGRCKTFDARADGFVRGEGCGVVVLRRLADALADGDRVLAVVRGSAVNQDGRSSVLTAPSGPAQERSIRDALGAARVDPAWVSYVEAHGTGTALGDPIELEALAHVVGAGGTDGACAVGSVKTNLGHLEAAAGMAGLIKTVLALEHARIPPHLHFTALNPHASLEGTRLEIRAGGSPWPRGDRPRFAGVSAFGFGGTNAHIVLEEAPVLPETAAADSGGPLVLPVSARSDAALAEAARRLRGLLEERQDAPAFVRDVCRTASLRRTHFEERLVAIGDRAGDLIAALDAFAAGQPPWTVARGRAAVTPPSPVFVFSGQGPQWWGMGRELIAREPVFRRALEEVEALFRAVSGWSLIEALTRPEAESRLGETKVAQPAIFAVQVALAALWKSRGVVPGVVVGHSVGEIAAAHVAGALDLETAVRLVYHRGRLMQAATGHGRMASVERSAGDVGEAIGALAGRLSVAAINGPRSTVISGEPAAVATLVADFEARGVSCRLLPVNYAFHSPQMAAIATRLPEAVGPIVGHDTTVTMFSTVTGGPVAGPDLTAEYWRRNVAEPVRFADAIGRALADGHRVFLEIGPHPVLRGDLAQCAAAHLGRPLILASLRRERPEQLSMLAAFGALHVAGCQVDWASIHPGRHRVVSLPPYPWQRQRYWVDATPVDASREERVAAPETVGALTGRRVTSAFVAGVSYQYRVGRHAPVFVADHRVGGHVVFPAMGVVAMAFDAVRQTGLLPCRIEGTTIREAFYPDERPRSVQVLVGGDGDDRPFEVAIERAGEPSAGWQRYASGRIRRTVASAQTAVLDRAAIEARCPTEVGQAEHYAAFAARGLEFGPSFQGVQRVWRRDLESLGEVRLPPGPGAAAGAALDPCLLDACAQVLWHALPTGAQAREEMYLPVAIDGVELLASAGLPAHVWSHATVASSPGAGDGFRGAVSIHDSGGARLAVLEGIVLRQASRQMLSKGAGADRLYEVRWQQEELPASPRAAPRPGAHWLVLADRDGVGLACAERLKARGASCTVAFAGGDRAGSGWSEDDLRAAFAESTASGRALAGVIHLGALDVPTGAAVDESDLEGAWQAACGSLLIVAQSIIRTGSDPRPSLFVFTSGAQNPDDRLPAPLRAGVLGLARTLALEHPEVSCVRVDLDPDDPDPTEAILDVLGRPGVDEVAIRGGVRFARRLAPLSADRLAPAPPRRLEILERGALDRLRLEPLARRRPGEGEVEVVVRAAGLNFRDVLNALGTYAGPPGPLGDESAGTVAAVGPGVSGLSVGDEVVAVASGSLATHVIARASLTVRKPSRLPFAEAAGCPIAFLTADYALLRRGRLKAGERVLIHAAAGGVGLAAVQVAQRAGAEVFATAGSERKRAWLRARGVRHVFDSRSMAFAAGIRAVAGERGIEVVLNSLTGELIPAGLGLLAPGGRFVEIGRSGIWTPEEVARTRPDVGYDVVFLGDLFERDPATSHDLLCEVMGAIERGEYQPLPVRTSALSHAEEAFRFMAQARHIGKLVLVPGADGAEVDGRPAVRADRSYVVTGGLGALGLQVARALVDAGARHLVLTGRSAPTVAATAVVAALVERGVTVDVVRGDISHRDDVSRVIRTAEGAAPIGGIVHAAGIVRDASFLQQDTDRLVEVVRPKVDGARWLHELTIDQPLDFFVLFSSAAALMGSAGQANYAAANAALDAFATWRQGQGLPAVAIGWGPWADGGMATVLGDREQTRLTSQGWHPFSPEEGRGIFRTLCRSRRAQVAAFELSWPQYLRQFRTTPPLLASVAASESSPDAAVLAPAADTSPVTLLEELAALPAAARRGALAAHVTRQVTRVLGAPGEQRIGSDVGLRDCGLDSLMAIELRNVLQGDLGRSLPATLAFDYPTVDDIVGYLVETLGFGAARTDESPDDRQGDEAAAVRSMSDAEAEALLDAELNAIQGRDRKS